VGPGEKVAQLLGGVPHQLVAFGSVHGEPGVVVAVICVRERRDRGAHVVGGFRPVDVPGHHGVQRHRAQDPDCGRVAVIAGAAELAVRDLTGQHDPAWSRVRVRREQPQRRPGRLHQRDIFKFVQVAAGIPFAQRGRDGETRGRGGPYFPSAECGGERRERRRQIYTHRFLAGLRMTRDGPAEAVRTANGRPQYG
jgi:hypothetical protein